MPQPREPKVGEIQEYADAKSRNKTGRRQEVGAFRFESYSLKVVTGHFPDAYDNHFFHDYLCC